MKSYKTVKKSSEETFIEKKSRFIGHCKPVKTEEEALAFIEKVKKEHITANHNVYAYTVRKDNITRYSDNGEPKGSAGIPVLSVMQKAELCDMVVVVTRYFGGILLGGGGLVRAYSHTASLAVKASVPVMMEHCTRYKLKCDYNKYPKAQSYIEECGGQLEDTLFEDFVYLCFYIKPEDFENLSVKLLDLTNGNVEIEETGSGFFPIEI